MASRKKNARRRPSPKPAPAPRRRRTAAGGDAMLTIRHYCQGIGDCHLLTFRRDDGSPLHMLIDCGIHTSVEGGRKKIDAIVDDLARRVEKDAPRGGKGRIDVLVATHEHTDHISGFASAKEKFGRLRIGEIWLGWTENPLDPQAVELDRFKGQALAVLDAVSERVAAQGVDRELFGLGEKLQPVLGFFGAKGDRIRSARDILTGFAPDRLRYLEPGGTPLTLPGVSNVRVYVLGPPRSAKMLGIRDRPGETYGLGGGWPVANGLEPALGVADGMLRPDQDWGAPFDPSMGQDLPALLAAPRGRATREPAGSPRNVWELYRDKDPWRRIDNDWLGAGAELAIQLDDRTNNSSLVLAFEFVDTGRVVLFTGDAQVGSWLSWQDLEWKVGDRTVKGPELLARTVYYKVGHHGSHNATLKQKGLELMDDPDLAAFIPTNEKDARKVKWGQMPFAKILEDLGQRSSGRVIRADDPWLRKPGTDRRFAKPSGSIRAVRHEPDLWVELDIA